MLAALPTEGPLPSDAGLALIAVLRGLLQLPASKGNGGAPGEQRVPFSETKEKGKKEDCRQKGRLRVRGAAEIRTLNLLLRRQTPCPLGHGG